MPAGKARNSCRLCVLLLRPEFKYRHMHIYISQNTPCLPPNAPPPPPPPQEKVLFTQPLLFLRPGYIAITSREIDGNTYAKFCRGGGRRTRSINMGDVQIECIEDKFLVTTPPPEFQVTGGKTQHPKKSLGLPTKPPKIPCRIKFPRHKNFQKAY